MKFLKTRTRAKLIFLAVLALTILAIPATAFAHPLGNFTVNQYSRIEVGSAGVNVFFVLDMAEIPTFQEKDLIDQNKDGQISADESSQYADAKTKQLLSNLKLGINGAPTQMNIVSDSMSFIAGQGNLQTLRLVAHFQTAALPSNASTITYSDSNYSDRIGWREIILRNATGVAINQSSVPDKDQTNELRVYPEDMLASPLQVTSVQAAFKLDPSIVVTRNDYPQDVEIVKTQDPLANLINGELTVPIVLFALLGSIVLGMFHALSPGHGKTVVAAYLVGSRGTAKHAVFLGLTVTITHTIGVFALGLITLFASQYILPETLYPWLGLLSGLLVVGMGISLFRSRLLTARKSGGAAVLEAAHTHSHDDNHEHSSALATHTHSHDDHTHSHDHDHDHEHAHPHPVAVTLAEHTHSHDDHTHSHADHTHTQDHDHEHAHSHDHADHVHTHEVTAEKVEAIKIERPVLEPALAMTAAGAADGGVLPVDMRAATLEPPTTTSFGHTHSHDDHSHDHPAAVGFAPHSHDDHSHDHDHGDAGHTHSHDDHSHDHEHDHVHTLEAHTHSHDDHEHSHDHSHDHDHSHADGTMHSHGGKMHSHLPPGTDGQALTWKSLLLFGISAGLLPCPSALVLMLSAIGLNRTLLGLIMIVFFSAGLAGTLTGIGLLMVYARDRFSRVKDGRLTRVMRFLPIVSAALVAILGLALTWTGLIQTGIIK